MDDSPAARHPIVAIAGPTGSGKSALALGVAERFHGAIVNCDSVQIYRYFNIGTAKTPENERRGIPHYLIDALDPDQVFTAGDFSRAGRQALHEITAAGELPVVAGGTGFYLRALLDGLAPGPSRDEALRRRLANREKRRPGSLHKLLARFDRVTAARIHPHDLPKTIRALEICLASRRPAATIFAAGRNALAGFRTLKIGLFPARDALYERLEQRIEQMFAHGLVEETASILARGFPASAKPFESIGYKQALQVVEGELSVKEAIFHARQATRRYAKRQMTWFRQEPGLEIFSGFGDDSPVAARVNARIEAWLTDSA